MTARTTLILGGARSGKTRRALALCEPFPERWYIATAEALDEEMAARIAAHRAERGQGWKTVETPLGLPDAIRALPAGDAIAVADCLTLWLSNLMHSGADVEQATADLCDAIARAPCHLVLVSNETGLGLVPETPLGRTFRDRQGLLNQAVATAAESVEFVVAGLPMKLK